jgi:hypothetical protein
VTARIDQPPGFIRRAADLVRPSCAALAEQPLKLGQVRGGQRLVHPEFRDHDMVEALAEERARLGDELGLIGTNREARQNKTGLAAH